MFSQRSGDEVFVGAGQISKIVMIHHNTKWSMPILAQVLNGSAAFAYACNKTGCSRAEAATDGTLRDPDKRFARPLGYTTYIT